MRTLRSRKRRAVTPGPTSPPLPPVDASVRRNFRNHCNADGGSADLHSGTGGVTERQKSAPSSATGKEEEEVAVAVPAVAIGGLRFLTPGRAPRAPLPCRFPVAADSVAAVAARPEVAKEKADSAARRFSRRLAPHAAHAHALSAAGPRRTPTEHAAIHTPRGYKMPSSNASSLSLLRASVAGCRYTRGTCAARL